MRTLQRRHGGRRFLSGLAILVGLLTSRPAPGQIPGLPAAPAAAKGSSSSGGPGGPATEKSKAAVATSTGPIAVQSRISDDQIQDFLGRFLPKYPGVEQLIVTVKDGVVTLGGRVADEDTQSDLTDVVKRVEGVRLVLNQTQTDEEVMTAWEFARRELGDILGFFKRKWILILISLAIVALSWLLAQAFAKHSETLLSPFVGNVLLRSVIGSVISGLIVIFGLVMALGTLRLTQMVMSILGVSGLIVLAVGFAFRDITENFIASVLLGLRRPFQVGDYVTIAGQSGVVKSLNTRATVLVTLEGKHVRIPNATIFKEIMVNSTASPSFRASFDVVIPSEASTAAALDAINRALRETPGILPDPPPRALVEALEPGGVRLRADLWTPTHNIDWFQLMSDAKLRTKVALQQAGVIGTPASAPAPAPAAPDKAEDRPNGRSASKPDGASAVAPAPAAAAERQAAANLARDARAARDASTAVCDHGETPMARVLEEPETRVSDEGANLLKGPRAE